MSDENKAVPIVVSANLKKTAVKLDGRGNIISDFKTKRIIQPVADEAVPTAVEAPQDTTNLSLKELSNLIEQKENEIDELKQIRREKVKKLRAELEEMEDL